MNFIKNFCSKQLLLRKLKSKPQWDKVIAIYLYNKEFEFTIQKEFLKFNNKKTTNNKNQHKTWTFTNRVI